MMLFRTQDRPPPQTPYFDRVKIGLAGDDHSRGIADG